MLRCEIGLQDKDKDKDFTILTTFFITFAPNSHFWAQTYLENGVRRQKQVAVGRLVTYAGDGNSRQAREGGKEEDKK